MHEQQARRILRRLTSLDLATRLGLLLALVIALASLLAPGATPAARPKFTLVVKPHAVKVVRGSSYAISVTVRRRRGFRGPVTVSLRNLPAGTRATSVVLRAGRPAAAIRVFAREPAVLDRPTSIVAFARARIASARQLLKLTVVPTFTYAIDPSLRPAHPIVSDGHGNTHTLGVSKDELGVRSTFYSDAVILRPDSPVELQAFLERYDGRVIGTDAVPAPPPGLGRTVAPAARRPTEYLVRVDASQMPLAGFAEDAAQTHLGTHATFSDTLGEKLMALSAREQANGVSASLSYVFTSDAVRLQTRERPSGGVNLDAYNASQFPRFQSGGSRASVTAAWTWVAAHGIARRVRVAIIDGGFWLDGNGAPLTGPGDGSDLPANPIEYDFVGDDRVAAGVNPAACSGGSPCQWHGNGSAGVAVGAADNRFGAAGTGGFVGDPMLFQTDIRNRVQRDRAVRTAVAWGADVISMSFGGPCNYACRQDERSNHTNRGYEQARAAGIVLVASAGNGVLTNGTLVGTDAGAEDAWVHPCITDGVICVGALNDGLNTAQSYSNFGAPLDIWAPTNVWVMPDGGTMNGLLWHTGTSASAPFVAGIAAMMKAIDPGLTSDRVRDILVNTAWKDSTDPKVGAYVNALAAVKAASAEVLPSDRFEPNDGEPSATTLAPRRHDDLTLHDRRQRDFYRVVVPSRSSVAFNFTTSDDLGSVNLGYGLVAEQSCGFLDGELDVKRAHGRDLTVATVPRGRYLLAVGGGTPMPYDLVVGLSPVALPFDPLERNAIGQDNNVLARARSVSPGNYNATIGTGEDVDFYTFTSTGSFFDPRLGGTSSRFVLMSSDVPLRLTLFDSAGSVVRTAQTSNDCETQAAFENLPVGVFVVKVESPSNAPGAYNFVVGRRFLQGTGFMVERPWYIDPLGPIEWVLILKELDFGFRLNTVETIAKTLVLTGRGVHVTVLNPSGRVLLSGRPTLKGSRQIGETLSLRALAPNLGYYLKVARAVDRPLRNEPQGNLAGIPIRLTFSP